MVWPERQDTWRERAGPAQRAYAAVANAIAQFEPVTMCASAAQWERARAALGPRCRLVEMSSDDAWMRDQGPTFVVNRFGDVRGVDWDFNAWGGVNSCWDQDRLIARKVIELERMVRYQPNMILEGGSIDVDGEGTLLTTRECLLNPNRNPNMGAVEIEERLKDYLDVSRIIWLDRGHHLDTLATGHVDNLCRFVRPGVVALAWTDDRADPQWEISNDAFARLCEAADARGRRLEVHKLHLPAPLGVPASDRTEFLTAHSVDRLPASYVNFYIANGALIVPTFDDPMDQPALQTLRGLFPGRQLVGLPSRDILLGGGAVHCITLQEPRRRRKEAGLG